MSLLDKWRRWRAASAEAELFTLNWLDPRRRTRNEAWIRRLCHDVYLGDKVALCRVLGRYKMFVDTTDVSVSLHLLMDGYWEMWLTEALAETVKPGMTTIDIGANLGYFSLLMAELVGTAGQVHAFDANAHIAALAQRSAWINGFADRLTVHEQALGDVEGAEVMLAVPEGQPGGGHILPAPADRSEETATITTRRLDAYPGLLDADVVKIDVEGAEEAIWHGMTGLFARGRPLTIFLEFVACRYADPVRFLTEIQAERFTLARLEPLGGIRSVRPADILAFPADADQMLVLRR